MRLVAIVLASACFQDLKIVNFGSFALKPFHIVCVIVLLYTLLAHKARWKLPAPLFSVGLLTVLSISLIDYMRFGFNSMLLNYIFMYLIAACVYNIGYKFKLDDWKRIIQFVAMLVILLVYVKMAVHFDALRAFFHDSWAGHPSIPTFLGGGVNLEASWLAMFNVFFDDDKRGKVYLALTIALSMLYASRAGLIICILAFGYVFVLRKGKRGISTRMVVSTLALFAAFMLLAAQGNVVVSRILSTGHDRGSAGRLNMWQYALPTFLDTPILGNGAGNATLHMSIIGQTSSITENNVHMYALQVLLDFGLIGLLIFCAMVVYFVRQCWNSKLSSPFEAYVLIYLIVSFVQFRGGDVLLGFALGGLFLAWSGRSAEIPRLVVRQQLNRGKTVKI